MAALDRRGPYVVQQRQNCSRQGEGDTGISASMVAKPTDLQHPQSHALYCTCGRAEAARIHRAHS
eukprot:51785-Eustigmatos_ZCMA.PRE.1